MAAKTYLSYPETDRVFEIDGVSGLNTAIVGDGLNPWEQRKRTAMELMPVEQQVLNRFPGILGAAFQLSPLPGSGRGLPVQFVIKTTRPFNELNTVAQAVLQQARASGRFLFADSDLKIDKQQVRVEIDRYKTAQLGLTMQDVGNVLSSSLSQNFVNYFDLSGRSYRVIPQVSRYERLNYQQLLNYYIKTSSGMTVPLSTIIHFSSTTVPEVLNHFQQLNSATITAVPAPNVTQGDAITTLRNIAKPLLTEGYSIDYSGQSRQYVQESTSLEITFVFALIIIFLSLSALFESFRDPFIVLISVPMSICGAMIFISMGIGGATLNIYTEVGLVTLIGLISKHGILIVQFANDLQAGRKKQARSHRKRRRYPLTPHFNDLRLHGVRRYSLNFRHRRRRCQPL